MPHPGVRPGRRVTPAVFSNEDRKERYRQTDDGGWTEHFCIVNPGFMTDSEGAAVGTATRDLDRTMSVRHNGGSDAEVAAASQSAGYVLVDGYRRAAV